MNKELQTRERRLRYRAKQKGLRIQKEHYGEYSGYLISRYDSGMILAEYHHYDNLIPIKEAEEFVAEY